MLHVGFSQPQLNGIYVMQIEARMRALLANGVLIVSVVAGCSGDTPTRSPNQTTISFSGTITEVFTFGEAELPAGVGQDAEFFGTVSYARENANCLTEPNKNSCALSGTADVISLTIAATTWTLPITVLWIWDNDPSGDQLAAFGATSSMTDFPRLHGSGRIELRYLDNVEPFDLLQSTDLPSDGETIDFSEGMPGRGSLSSVVDADGWTLRFEVAESSIRTTR